MSDERKAEPLKYPPEVITGYEAERIRLKRPVRFYVSKYLGGDAPRGHVRIESDDGQVLIDLEMCMEDLAEALTGTSARASALISVRVK